jgi:hypothetical protein
MDDKPAKRAAGSGGAIVAAIAAVLLLFPMIYLLAIGPIVWLHRRGYVDVAPTSVIGRVYAPAEWAAQACPPFARAIEAYVSLWQPVETPVMYAPRPNLAATAPATSAPTATSAPSAATVAPADPESAQSEL